MDIQILKELDKFRDIIFFEKTHTYFYRELECVSTTAVVGMYQKPFETAIIASKYSKKHNIPIIEVLKDWEDKRDSAAMKGTHVHAFAEYMFQNKRYEDPFLSEVDTKLLDMVTNFYRDTKDKMIMVKAELVVGDYNLGICGMVDKLFYNLQSKEFQIWDYKTNKDIKEFSPYGSKLTDGLDHLYDCEMTKFSLQLGIYKYLIEKNTNIKLGNSYICWLNSDKNQNYVPIQAWNLDEEVRWIINNHKFEQ